MIEFDVAQQRLARAGHYPETTEVCELADALGRILAQDIQAQLDMPPADNSAMDGYAVRLTDLAEGRVLPIQQRCYAGDMPETLKAGMAIRIFTGSLLPPGADTVVIQENCQEDEHGVRILEMPEAGVNIRRRGEDMRVGEVLIQTGTKLSAAHIAQLAAQGHARLSVYQRLTVGILTTGDELTPAGQPLLPGQIYNSNAPMLRAQLLALDVARVRALHAPDTLEAIRDALQSLLADCDLVLTVGGVSVGEKDLVKPAIESIGGELDLWKVRMKPGKPLALAYVQDKPLVCLPGNPVSSYAVFSLMVSPLIRRLQGRRDTLPTVRHAILQGERHFEGDREEFIRVQVGSDEQGRLLAQPFSNQGSGVISSLPWAQALARIPADTHVAPGDVVRLYEYSQWQA
ncbi:molybdopterin molybdotransferase MoeA [Alcaligenes sp. SDU_A2]|uniref:molybdopterin molybdotransferase MoeA n=1 Tax=Alcaligenes sp. SDU_A2 TaxID=3136634 RepID=UPI00311E8248